MTQLRTNLLLTFSVLLASTFFYCKAMQQPTGNTAGPTTTQTMPDVPDIRPGDFTAEWRLIDSLENQG
ncbi:MAG: hypothetical protein EP344_15750, partial [Bacteroidetes bacterium]